MIEIVETPKEDWEAFMATFMPKVFEAASQTIELSTVPLCQQQANGELLHSSGVLLQLGDAKFLIGTAHNVVENLDELRPLHITLQGKGTRPIPLVEEKLWTTVDSKEDLLVTRLTDPTLSAMGDHYRFLRVSDLLSRNVVKKIGANFQFLILGFPFDTVEKDDDGEKAVKPWKYISVPFNGDWDTVENYDSHLHLILRYEQATWNEDGKRVHPPGMSGCGIWYIGNINFPEVRKPDEFKLVAIQTAWRKSAEYTKGTWIDVVLVIIWKHFPSCRDILRIHGFEYRDA
jgi:hypothetical protein